MRTIVRVPPVLPNMAHLAVPAQLPVIIPRVITTPNKISNSVLIRQRLIQHSQINITTTKVTLQIIAISPVQHRPKTFLISRNSMRFSSRAGRHPYSIIICRILQTMGITLKVQLRGCTLSSETLCCE